MLPAAAIAVMLATPRPLPFTYSYDTLPKGDLELEIYSDLSPAKVTSNGSPQNILAPQLQLELEYGLSHRVELGLYATLSPTSSLTDAPELPVQNGSKQRLRIRLFDEGTLPVDVALYGEVVETDREFEIEAKLIVQRRIAQRLRLIANWWVEREWEYAGDQSWVLNPTLGATVELSPQVHLGAETWMRWALPDGGEKGGIHEFNHGPHLYAGPVVMLNFGRVWWAGGFYFRATDRDHHLEPGEGFGSMWFRSVVGVYL
jgi:hypothetical protein